MATRRALVAGFLDAITFICLNMQNAGGPWNPLVTDFSRFQAKKCQAVTVQLVAFCYEHPVDAVESASCLTTILYDGYDSTPDHVGGHAFSHVQAPWEKNAIPEFSSSSMLRGGTCMRSWIKMSGDRKCLWLGIIQQHEDEHNLVLLKNLSLSISSGSSEWFSQQGTPVDSLPPFIGYRNFIGYWNRKLWGLSVPHADGSSHILWSFPKD